MDDEVQIRMDWLAYGTASWLLRADGSRERIDPRNLGFGLGVPWGLQPWLEWNERRAG